MKQHSMITMLVVLLAGSLSVLGFAPYHYWPVTLLTPAVLFVTLRLQIAQTGRANGFWPGWLFGLGYYGFGIYWIHTSISVYGGTPLPIAIALMAAFVMFLALFPALACYVLQKYFHQTSALVALVAFACLWVFQEWLKSIAFTGFPWLDLGYSQTENWLFALAPLGGNYLISFCSILIGGACILWLTGRSVPLSNKLWASVLALFCVGLSYYSQSIEWTRPAGSAKQVTLVQGNIPQDLRWLTELRGQTVERYLHLTASHWNDDVIIWPEAAIPAFPFEVPTLLKLIEEQTDAFDSVLITGLPTYQNEQILNTISVFGPQGKGEYHKHRLVPFGEFLPFEPLLKKLGDIIPFFALPMSSFSAGSAIQPPMRAYNITIAAALCYEIAYGQQLRNNWQNSDWILTLSNDAWFGDSIGPHQHLQLARMRARELGRPVIRATNNGITAFIDHMGQIVAAAPQFQQTTLQHKLQRYTGRTLFAHYGQNPWLCGYLLILVACYAISRQRTQRIRGVTAQRL